MKIAYDEYYQTEDLFGQPYSELIDFFEKYHKRGKLLDLGCGQGRDAIPLAKLGYEVTGIDYSKTGIEQMNEIAQIEQLNLIGLVSDIFEFTNFQGFEFILLDSMFHFSKKDRRKEIDFVKRIIRNIKDETIIVFCIQNIGNKVNVLNETIDFNGKQKRIFETDLEYLFEDKETGHSSKTPYKIIAIEIKNSN